MQAQRLLCVAIGRTYYISRGRMLARVRRTLGPVPFVDLMRDLPLVLQRSLERLDTWQAPDMSVADANGCEQGWQLHGRGVPLPTSPKRGVAKRANAPYGSKAAFSVEHVISSNYGLSVIGRVREGVVGIGTRFGELHDAGPERLTTPCCQEPADAVFRPVSVRVCSVDVYRWDSDVLSGGVTYILGIDGEGLEHVGHSAILVSPAT
jgi:hypothetical protein